MLSSPAVPCDSSAIRPRHTPSSLPRSSLAASSTWPTSGSSSSRALMAPNLTGLGRLSLAMTVQSAWKASFVLSASCRHEK